MSAYGRHLAYPDVIWVQVGSKDHDEVIPAELFHIAADQRYTRKLPSEFSSSMVQFSSKHPQDLLTFISAEINNLRPTDTTRTHSPSTEYRHATNNFSYQCMNLPKILPDEAK